MANDQANRSFMDSKYHEMDRTRNPNNVIESRQPDLGRKYLHSSSSYQRQSWHYRYDQYQQMHQQGEIRHRNLRRSGNLFCTYQMNKPDLHSQEREKSSAQNDMEIDKLSYQRNTMIQEIPQKKLKNNQTFNFRNEENLILASGNYNVGQSSKIPCYQASESQKTSTDNKVTVDQMQSVRNSQRTFGHQELASSETATRQKCAWTSHNSPLANGRKPISEKGGLDILLVQGISSPYGNTKSPSNSVAGSVNTQIGDLRDPAAHCIPPKEHYTQQGRQLLYSNKPGGQIPHVDVNAVCKGRTDNKAISYNSPQEENKIQDDEITEIARVNGQYQNKPLKHCTSTYEDESLHTQKAINIKKLDSLRQGFRGKYEKLPFPLTKDPINITNSHDQQIPQGNSQLQLKRLNGNRASLGSNYNLKTEVKCEAVKTQHRDSGQIYSDRNMSQRTHPEVKGTPSEHAANQHPDIIEMTVDAIIRKRIANRKKYFRCHRSKWDYTLQANLLQQMNDDHKSRLSYNNRANLRHPSTNISTETSLQPRTYKNSKQNPTAKDKQVRPNETKRTKIYANSIQEIRALVKLSSDLASKGSSRKKEDIPQPQEFNIPPVDNKGKDVCASSNTKKMQFPNEDPNKSHPLEDRTALQPTYCLKEISPKVGCSVVTDTHQSDTNDSTHLIPESISDKQVEKITEYQGKDSQVSETYEPSCNKILIKDEKDFDEIAVLEDFDIDSYMRMENIG